MRLPVGRAPVQRAVGGERAGHRVDGDDLERVRDREVGQQTRQPRGEHRLPDPRRPDQAQVVTACGRDLHGEPALHLPGHVGQVQVRLRDRGPGRAAGSRVRVHAGRPGVLVRLGQRVATQQREHLAQGRDREHVEVRHQTGLGGVRGRDQRTGPARPDGPEQRGQHAADRADPAVQAELAEHDRVPARRQVQPSGGAQHGQGDREVEVRAALRQCRGAQSDGDPPVRPPLTGVDDGRPDAVAALGQRRVRQPDEHEGRQPVAQVRLDLDDPAVDPDDGGRPAAGQRHQRTPRRWSTLAAPRSPRSTATTSTRTAGTRRPAAASQRAARRRCRAAFAASTASSGLP